MKWSIVGLLVAGLISALCVSVLVASWQAKKNNGNSTGKEVEILVAAKPLAAMSLLDPSCFTTKKVSANHTPEGYLSQAVQIQGRILSVPMIEGQAFTNSCLVKEGTGLQLASTLPNNTRAVSVSLNASSSLEALLYPGSLVDVLSSFKLPNNNREKGQAISTTLIQGVKVIAVENQTIVSQEEKGKSMVDSSVKNQSQHRTVVTLQVTPKQAEALQLAMDHGSVTLALRNPNDTQKVDVDATLLSEGRLAESALLLPSSVAEEFPTAPAEMIMAPSSESVDLAQQGLVPMWQIAIIRGSEMQIQNLPLPQEK